MEKKLYVLVRKDLPTSQQAVQAGHAIAEFLLREKPNDWDNGTLVLLGVGSEFKLIEMAEKMEFRGIRSSGFREPDMENQLTAVAALPDDGKMFKRLSLL